MSADAQRACVICGNPIASNKNAKYCVPCGNNAWRRRAGTAAALPVEHRQPPLTQCFTLQWHPQIVIGPDMPARVRRYTNGRPTPYQDDLAAIANHGSRWYPIRPEEPRSYTGCAADMLVGVA